MKHLASPFYFALLVVTILSLSSNICMLFIEESIGV